MERRSEILHLSQAQIAAAVQHVVPGARVISAALAAAGRANTNYIVESPEARYVLRIYVRDHTLAAKEGALHTLLQSALPVATILGSSSSDCGLGHPFSLLEFVNGETLEQVAVSGER
ncbi:MAG TPA: phosphotransferase, partial [Polyangiaceae bacterium]|nr:phosphotransferase [Polyangiaceae bacterium]